MLNFLLTLWGKYDKLKVRYFLIMCKRNSLINSLVILFLIEYFISPFESTFPHRYNFLQEKVDTQKDTSVRPLAYDERNNDLQRFRFTPNRRKSRALDSIFTLLLQHPQAMSLQQILQNLHYKENTVRRNLNELSQHLKLVRKGKDEQGVPVYSIAPEVKDRVNDILPILNKIPTGANVKKLQQIYRQEVSPILTEVKLSRLLKGKAVLFVSFRWGQDGVTKETEKLGEVLGSLGAEIYYYPPREETSTQPRIGIEHYLYKPIRKLVQRIFNNGFIASSDMNLLNKIKKQLKNKLLSFIVEHRLNKKRLIIIAENICSFPLNPALSLAVLELIDELNKREDFSGVEFLVHSHDFWWERPRFKIPYRPSDYSRSSSSLDAENLFNEIVRRASSWPLMVINSSQIEVLSRQMGIENNVYLMPNVMDFKHPPSFETERARRFRNYFKLEEDSIVVIAPVRPIRRKRLKHALDICEQIHTATEKRVYLLITHTQHAIDEDDGRYWEEVQRYGKEKRGVIIKDASIEIENGDFTIKDAFRVSNLFVYPSSYEGFGDALLRAVYYGVPYWLIDIQCMKIYGKRAYAVSNIRLIHGVSYLNMNFH